ncbi:RNA polymerase sigma factor [Radiobacillus sp. PE A8.2]|uniref:RNA polymerase sigma factor n=1 Tax=Radiobacillus sp. PE A8.2 TaxID=3380349 RepID=UPI0038905394
MEQKQIIADWFDAYSEDIYHFLVYRIGYLEAEDLVQEVFIRAYRALHSYQENAKPKSWLLSIARNIAIDTIRQRNRKQLFFPSYKYEKELDHQEGPEHILVSQELNHSLYHAIHTLNPRYRDVLILKGLKELSVSETAYILGWKESKVRLTYHRAKKALKTALGGESNES